MSFQEALNRLRKNPSETSSEAVRLLLKIAENIIKDPSNSKVRTLQKSNSTIKNRILSVEGGKDCLKSMGFVENSTTFTMSSNASIDVVKKFRSILVNGSKPQINKLENSKKQSESNLPSTSANNEIKEEFIEPIVLPPLILTNTNPFLRRMETYAHNVHQYENKNLQVRAKNLLPLNILEENARKRLRAILEMVKKNKLKDPEISVQDTLIIELLGWFKNDFFEWVDSPDCETCGSESKFSHNAIDPKLLVYTNRVELHKCTSCNHLTPFPRYEDLNILLETRRGRCGEWANVFTLFCRALGWDARFIVEENDHVWTEVFSITQNRWLHCDPCENACDTPLIYETGWHKQISYVMAYSAEDVQDVTWRYSCNHKKVLERRKECSEKELLEALLKIRLSKQKNLSEAKKKYLNKRVLFELVEFLTEKKPNGKDQQGRSSGAAAWRLARGEIYEDAKESQYIWNIDTDNLDRNTVAIRYFCALDKYESTTGNKVINTWNGGAYSHKGIFRNEEKDWKMVYLARKDGEPEGSISWKFEWKSSSKYLNTVKLNFDYTTYEDGVVTIKICSENTCIILPKGEKMATYNDFIGSKELTLTATVSHGKGNVAWQHAQLFRQPINSEDCSFNLTLTFN